MTQRNRTITVDLIVSYSSTGTMLSFAVSSHMLQKKSSFHSNKMTETNRNRHTTHWLLGQVQLGAVAQERREEVKICGWWYLLWYRYSPNIWSNKLQWCEWVSGWQASLKLLSIICVCQCHCLDLNSATHQSLSSGVLQFISLLLYFYLIILWTISLN